MKTRYLTLLLLVLAVLPLRSQEADSIMKLVLLYNPQLKTAREAANLSRLQAGTGNTPPDPQLEVGYLFGDPAAMGNKVNIVIRQEVDFPSAYIHRSRLREIRHSKADLEYLASRQDVLAAARILWLESIGLEQQKELVQERLEQARGVGDHVGQMKLAGEVGALEYSQAMLMLAAVESEAAEIGTQIELNRLQWEQMTAGHEIRITETRLPSAGIILRDSLLEAYRHGPEALLHEQLRLEKQSSEKLARSQQLPRLSGGYFSEAIPSEAFRGFTLGLSVPLWENARKLKSARADVLSSEARQEEFLITQEKELEAAIKKWQNLQDQICRLGEALDIANSPELLGLAMEEGEISLIEYFYASDFHFKNQQQLLMYEMEALKLEAGLMKVYY